MCPQMFEDIDQVMQGTPGTVLQLMDSILSGICNLLLANSWLITQ